MASKPVNSANTRNDFVSRISIIYRIYFLWFEPIAAIGGTYLCFFDPSRFVSATMPFPAFIAAAPIPMTPVLQLILRNLGAMYGLFAVQEGIVLRLTREKGVWFAVVWSMIFTDLGHLYAAWSIYPDQMFKPASWNSDEWVNYGTLMLGFLLRLFFVAGVGRK